MERTDPDKTTQRDSWWRRQLPPSPLARSLSVPARAAERYLARHGSAV